MGSHFGISTSRRRSPAYCIKGLWEGIDSYSAGRPIGLNGYVRLYDEIGTDFLDFNETFHLIRNQADNGYIGSNADTPPMILIAILDTPNPERYDIAVQVNIWGWINDVWTWHDVDISFRPPWGTPLLRKTWIPNLQFTIVRVLG